MPIRCRLLLPFLVLLPLVGQPAERDLYRSFDEPLLVQTETLTLTDPVQQRDVSFRFHVPAGDGPFPLVVYSHGAFCSPAMYDRITLQWAGHGYAVLLPQHLDALDSPNPMANPDRQKLLSSRVRELSLAVDRAGEIGASRGNKDLLDIERVAVAGHSFGAMIAAIKLGLRLKPGEYVFPGATADERFRAAVIMSGVGPLFPMTDDAFAGLTRPLIASGGTLDEGNVGMGEIYPWEWRMSPYTRAPPGQKYSLVLDEADHYLGGLICRGDRGGEADPDAVRVVAAVTLAFLDAYVRDDESAKDWLHRVDLATLTDGRASFARK